MTNNELALVHVNVKSLSERNGKVYAGMCIVEMEDRRRSQFGICWEKYHEVDRIRIIE